MLNDEAPRFSVKDIFIVVGIIATGTFAYSSLQSRVAAVESKVEAKELAGIPRRMDRLEYLICATADAQRATACEQMGVLR